MARWNHFAPLNNERSDLRSARCSGRNLRDCSIEKRTGVQRYRSLRKHVTTLLSGVTFVIVFQKS